MPGRGIGDIQGISYLASVAHLASLLSFLPHSHYLRDGKKLRSRHTPTPTSFLHATPPPLARWHRRQRVAPAYLQPRTSFTRCVTAYRHVARGALFQNHRKLVAAIYGSDNFWTQPRRRKNARTAAHRQAFHYPSRTLPRAGLTPRAATFAAFAWLPLLALKVHAHSLPPSFLGLPRHVLYLCATACRHARGCLRLRHAPRMLPLPHLACSPPRRRCLVFVSQPPMAACVPLCGWTSTGAGILWFSSPSAG